MSSATSGSRATTSRTSTRRPLASRSGATLATGVVKWHGEHLIKAGATVGYMTVTGVEDSRPVDYVRSNGTLARRYEFSGPGAFDASLVDGGFFVQDTWALRAGLRVDLGARWDASTAASGLALWPRAVVSYDLRPNSTKLSSGVGVFADKALLAAPIFPDRQARREMLYDESGQHLQSSHLFTNRTRRSNRDRPLAHLERPARPDAEGRLDGSPGLSGARRARRLRRAAHDHRAAGRRTGADWRRHVAITQLRGDDRLPVSPRRPAGLRVVRPVLDRGQPERPEHRGRQSRRARRCWRTRSRR